MIQSTLHVVGEAPRRPHVAIIMDGNGRWATRRGWPRAAGHHAGVEAVRRVVHAAPRLGIGTLTLYAFSSDNWRRPAAEVALIFELLATYLRQESPDLAAAGVRCSVIGRRDRLPAPLRAAIVEAEEVTCRGRRLWLRIAIDYSSRGEIAAAVSQIATAPAGPESLRARLTSLLEADAGPVDLLIRTGGDQRLSDFLLWEAAYAELLFTRTRWPDFGAAHLRRALASFARRERRFGGLEPQQNGIEGKPEARSAGDTQSAEVAR